MRPFGFELEMSDIRTSVAAEIVYGEQEWIDRWGGYSKPILDYSKWNLQSDATIRNSDGTVCMSSYIDDYGTFRKASNSRNSPDRLLWRGAELISPVITATNYNQQFTTYRGLIQQLIDNGAIFSPRLYNSLHIHIDINDIELTKLMTWPKKIYKIQNELDALGNDWKRKLFSKEEIEDLSNCKTVEEFVNRMLLKGDRKVAFTANSARRIVDITPSFNPSKPNTVEFRCFKPVPTQNYIEAASELCQELVQSWINDEELDLTESIPYNKLKHLENYEGKWLS